METSFFKGATNVRIGGNTQFHNVVAGRDVHQVNNLGDTYNTNSNNRNKTVIKDSYNDNSQHISGSSARNHPLAGRSGRGAELSEDDSTEWTDSTTDSTEEEYFEEDRRGNRRQQPARKKGSARSSKARPKPRPAAPDVRSAPNVHTAIPPARSTAPDPSEGRPAPEPVHAASAPAVPTQATSTQASPSPSPIVAPHLTVPPTPSVNTSSTSLTQSVATSTGVTPTTPSLIVNRPASAPVPSTLGSSLESSLTVPLSVQSLSTGVDQVDLSARYRYLVTRKETRDEIRRRLVNVAQSAPRDKFFALKEQATRANTILRLVEGSKEKILRNEDFVKLSLESHAVAFIAIMAAEKQTPDAKRVYNLLKILDDVEELVTEIVQNDGLSKWHLFKRGENKNSIKSYRRKLESWLRESQNDKDVTIDFALHQASNALSEALYMEQQYAIAVQEPPQEVPATSPAGPRMQMLVSSPGSTSTSISDVTRSAVALGSGSAAVINGEGPGNRLIHQNSHNNNSVNIYR